MLPAGTRAEIPSSLDPIVGEEVQVAWEKFSARMQDPDHFTIITADSTVHPHTWMKFDTSVPLLKAGCATLYCLNVDGIHLPLRVSVNQDKAMLLPKEDELGDDFMAELVVALVKAFGDEDTSRTEAEMKADIVRQHRLSKGQETLPLHLFANAPEQFCQLIDGRDFSVNPDRLMTPEEATEWSGMAEEISRANRAGQDVVIGEKGYGSYRRLQGEINFATGISLNVTNLNSDGSESSIQSTEFLTPVTQGSRELGALVCRVSCARTVGHLHASFDHGENDLFYFRQWKKQQEGK